MASLVAVGPGHSPPPLAAAAAASKEAPLSSGSRAAATGVVRRCFPSAPPGFLAAAAADDAEASSAGAASAAKSGDEASSMLLPKWGLAPQGVAAAAAELSEGEDDPAGAIAASSGWRGLRRERVFTSGIAVTLIVALTYALNRQSLSASPGVVVVDGFAADVQRPALGNLVELASAAVLASSPAGASKVMSLTNRPRSDDREYQYARLSNGLRILNIQDKRTLTFAAAVAVQAGSFNDPVDLPGLAHFCEHMVFLGTERYPKPSGFDDFMSDNGGSDNAWTANEVTVYHGGVSQAAGKEMMDRFSDFFRAPLFHRRFVEKEVHAINSEHLKNVQNPERRILEVLSSVANPASPVSRFKTGDIDTLFNDPKRKDIDPVKELKRYYRNHYCPSRMRLVTLGSHTVQEQLELAERTFGNIPPGDQACREAPRTFAQPAPYPLSRMGKWLSVQGTEPQPSLWIQWQVRDMTQEYESQPLEYLYRVLDYGGPDSLSRMLEDSLGLASGTEVLTDMSSAGTSIFFVTHLTDLGRQKVDVILDVIYAYIAMLVHSGVDDKLYSSLANIHKLQWDWSSPSGPQSTVADFAERMTRLPPEDLLTGDFLIAKRDDDLVRWLLSKLTPEDMNVAVVDRDAQSHGLFGDGQQVQHLPHWDINFTVDDLSDVLAGAQKKWTSWLLTANPGLFKQQLQVMLKMAAIEPASTVFPKAPQEVKGVPQELDLTHMHAEKVDDGDFSHLFGPWPQRMEDLDLFPAPGAKAPQAWFRSGWVTESPKVVVQSSFRPLRSPDEPYISALDALRLRVYAALLSEEIVPSLVDLTLAGGDYSLSMDAKSGISFVFSGFAPIVPQLAKKVLEKFNHFNDYRNTTEKKRFDRIMEELRQSYASYTGMPMTYALQERNLLLEPGTHSREETLAVIDDITLSSAISSTGELVLSKPLQMTALAMGNLAEQQAREIIDHLASSVDVPNWVKLKPVPDGKIELVEPVVRPNRPIEVRAINPRQHDPNDVTVISLIHGVATVESQVVYGILGRILEGVLWNELRTQRQLGYIVQAGYGVISNVDYISSIVQGSVLDADAMEAAIEMVLAKLMPERLNNMTEREFKGFKDATIQNLIEPPSSLAQEKSHFWYPIKLGGRCFEFRDQALKYLNSSLVSREAMAEAWARLSQPTTGVRSKIVVKYFADQRPGGPASDGAPSTTATLPERPNAHEVKRLFQQQGVPDDMLPLLRREHRQTDTFGRIDSRIRERLERQGGFYPTTLHCSLLPSTISALDALAAGASDGGGAALPGVKARASPYHGQPEELAPHPASMASLVASGREPPAQSIDSDSGSRSSSGSSSEGSGSSREDSSSSSSSSSTRVSTTAFLEPSTSSTTRGFSSTVGGGVGGGAAGAGGAAAVGGPAGERGHSGGSEPLLAALGKRAREVSSSMDAQDVAGTLSAYARLIPAAALEQSGSSAGGGPGGGAAEGAPRPAPEVLAALGKRLEAVATFLRPQDIAESLNAFGKLDYHPSDRLWNRIGERLEKVADQLNARNVSSVINSYAMLEHPPSEEVLARLAERAERVAGDMDAEDVVLNLIAYAKCWKIHEETLLSSMQGGNDMSKESGAKVLGAYATVWQLNQLQHLGASLLEALGTQAAKVGGDMSAAEVASALDSYASVGHRPPQSLLLTLGHRAGTVGVEMTAPDVARTLIAFAKVGYRPQGPTVAVLAQRCLELSHELGPHDVASVLAAFVAFGETPPSDLILNLGQRAIQLAEGMSGADVAIVLHAFAALNVTPSRALFTALEQRLAATAAGLDSQAVARVYYAFGTMGHSLEGPAKAPLERRAEQVGPAMNPENVTAVLATYVRLEEEPGESLLAVMARRAEELAPEMDSAEISSVANSYAKLWEQVSGSILASLGGGGGEDASPDDIAAAVRRHGGDGALAIRLTLMERLGKGLLDAVGRRVVEVAPEMNAESVANTLEAYAQLRETPGDEVLAALVERLQQVVNVMSAPDVARTIDAYTKLRAMEAD